MIIILSFSLFFSSCNMFDDDDKLSPEENLSLQMPFTQYLISYWRGIDIGRYQLQWSQHLSGVGSKYLVIDRYGMLPIHMNDIWYLYYNYIYRDLHFMLAAATDIDARAYRGMTRILHAYALGFMTDTWGDVPFVTASGYYTAGSMPVYDAQADLYMEIMNQLELGIQDINAAIQHGGFLPGPAEDPIYGGNINQWIKAANVIQLRHLLRMSHQADNYSLALGHITGRALFDGIHDDMVYVYDADKGQVNPHYFFKQYTRAGQFFVELLKAQDDPRIPYFLTKNPQGVYSGTAPGTGSLNSSFPGDALAGETAPLAYITYTEQKFIEAEVYYRMGMQAMADAAFEEAVISSLRSFDIEDPEWEATHAAIENVSLEQIMTAKYVALFLNPEVWSDYRRTGYPQLTPYQQAPNPEIPRRFLYADQEFNINHANVPKNVDMYTRMWWDVE
ncbi:MAG: SusD/RagB family nutrient-binding outer membrane lipoprotein [Bacteroidales bacterium]|nr:SusD/RagB family nutrient-binding outer membrane lipoprotein [Bacteroidales bacterium]